MSDEIATQPNQAIVDVAKERSSRDDPDDNIMVMPNGVKVRINPVAPNLIDDVTSRIEDPPVPMWHNPEKDRDEPNPADPDYLKSMARAERKRNTAAVDAMLMFGVELVDGLPEDTSWKEKIKFMVSADLLDLGDLDIDDPLTAEYLYKKYIITSAPVLENLTRVSGLPTEEIERAERSFQRN